MTARVGATEATVSWNPPTVSDDSGEVVRLVTTHEPNTLFSLGSETVTYTAFDNYGNSAFCSFDVIVGGKSTFYFFYFFFFKKKLIQKNKKIIIQWNLSSFCYNNNKSKLQCGHKLNIVIRQDRANCLLGFGLASDQFRLELKTTEPLLY